MVGMAEELSTVGSEHIPMVFLCTGCGIVLADSCGLVGNELQDEVVLFSVVSSNVSVATEQKLSKTSSDFGCLFEELTCNGCSKTIGRIYRCTPKVLDFKRDLFCLDIDSIESYILGSTKQQIISEKEDPISLESRAALEEELEKTKTVLSVLETNLLAIEAKLSSFETKS
ncbi:protein Mis18-alpha isoform X2 [Microcaecilia unicolor]|uniref:Protein Mis18-alpha n=1 Tax=Microcaecilia unicolor TaxID=1415580 RepID=A0A6P7XZJ2_9AMPH|nr:protein Mis18-alpha isoform X2 [Microcaecilia unicolor]